MVSFAYERGWRQSFGRAGFPGPDEEVGSSSYANLLIILLLCELLIRISELKIMERGFVRITRLSTTSSFMDSIFKSFQTIFIFRSSFIILLFKKHVG